ncbi:MAG: DEAD/DEAH box helicase family protein [Bacteroidota bacterium]|nr:DEAD/DEAH box helicase family protein [Bacteroidota bacterium]
MQNAFLRYEQDVKQWVDGGFPDVNPLTRDFLEHLRRDGAPRKLWKHQQESVYRAIYAYELLQMKNVLLNIVTGGGKTAIIGAIIAWLKYCHAIDKFLILCPNTIVRDRLEDDFTDTKVFRDFDFFPSGTEHFKNELGLHLLEPGSTPQGILESGIVLGNIHQLYQSNISGKRNLAYMMNFVEHLAVFNDEAHNTPAAEYDNTLFALSPKCKFRLDTTATPDRADGKTPDSKMIYEYGIADAQSEVPPIIKSIVVYQPKLSSVQLTYTNPETGEKRTVDEMDKEFEKIEKGLSATQWVTDPDPMRKQIAIALERLEEQKRRAASIGHGEYKPILFVVGICIKDAKAAAEMLSLPKEKGGFGINTVVVTEESSEDERLLAGIIGKRGKALEETKKNLERKFGLTKARELVEKGSQLEAVVSVLMLREGWDVPAVSVILLLRKFSSRVYGQQVVGRGLRLNIRGEDAQEFCAIVDHEKLKHNWLWETVRARVKTDIDLGNLFGDEDLPPKSKVQILDKPENIIDVPEPEEAEQADFSDLEDLKIVEGDYPNWQAILNSFEYGSEVEISKVEIESVRGTNLFGDGFTEISDAPRVGKSQLPEEEISKERLVEILKHTIRDIADILLAEEGIGSHELGYLYNIIMDHVQTKMLEGKSAGLATIESLKHTIRQRHNLSRNFRERPGLVASIVKYRKGS